MPTLSFFPWLRLRQNCAIGEYELIQYHRGHRLPFGDGTTAQRWIDELLASYYPYTKAVVDECTLLRHGDGDLTRDLTEDEKDGTFQFAELLAFAGLSERKFFCGALGPYCNRDHFQLVQITSPIPSNLGTSMKLRRRDGTNNVVVTGDAFRIDRPIHVSTGAFPFTDVDLGIAEALIKARQSDNWPRWQDAINCFNLANTDGMEMREHVELVLLVSAFEQLLDSRNGRETDLARNFIQVIQPCRECSIDGCSASRRIARGNTILGKGHSVREAWIRDLFRARNDFAHGNIQGRKARIWMPWEHLLLGGFIFPLAVKSLLNTENSFQLSQEDLIGISVFERLACADHRIHLREDEGAERFAWDKILSDAWSAAVFEPESPSF